MKIVFVLACLAITAGCNRVDDQHEYNFTITHVRANSHVAVYYCDDFIMTEGFLTFVDHNGVKRSISGDVDLKFRNPNLVRKYF